MLGQELERLEERRLYVCRLTPDRALETLDEAEAFLHERGMLTLMPDSSLPSLFGACHEEPYKAGGRGFATWPRTKYPWGVELGRRPGVYRLAVHRGKGLFVTESVARVVDPLAREALARAGAGELGEDASRLVEHLAAAGPSLLEELTEEVALDRRALKAARGRLESLGAVVAQSVVLEDPHRHTSELRRWDHLFPEPAGPAGGLAELLVRGVRAAVVAPERELATWFSWRPTPALIEELVAAGRLRRPAADVVTAAETASEPGQARPGP